MQKNNLPAKSEAKHGWQEAPDPAWRGWLRACELNWHLRQAWRLAPVSWSICCTAIRLHLCTRPTCVSWITFKLICGLRRSDSRPSGPWLQPQPPSPGNPELILLIPHSVGFTLPISNGGITQHYIPAFSLTLTWVIGPALPAQGQRVEETFIDMFCFIWAPLQRRRRVMEPAVPFTACLLETWSV